MKDNPLRKLASCGQSVWLDFISREFIRSGRLQRLIDEDGLTGVTSNPAIFEKAILGGNDYDDILSDLLGRGQSEPEVYDAITVSTVREACDVFRPVYDRAGGQDGFVSLEVSPHLAYDTKATVEEARRLWKAVDRPNVLIKIPATEEGIGAIAQCIGEGININVTLLFGLPRYQAVTDAYVDGLRALDKAGKPLDRVAGVASFFLSRIDSLVDPMLEKLIHTPESPTLAQEAHGLVAIASAKLAYTMYQEIFNTPVFRPLRAKGAHPQRLLWASTSTKNPAYSDVKYVEPLIGPETVNTLPQETLDAYRDHGNPDNRIGADVERLNSILARLPDIGIRLTDVARQLETEGIDKFVKPYDASLAAIGQKRGVTAGANGR